MSWRDAIARAVLGGKVGGVHPGGIHVYHSSPHDFPAFDWSKIGTGEGAQIRGQGFYFAENPKVSGRGGDYWHSFSNRFVGPENTALDALSKAGFDRMQAIENLRQRASTLGNDYPSKLTDNIRRHLDDTMRLMESGAPVGPRTYEVNINAKPHQLLDLDVGVGAQSPYVAERLRDLGIKPPEVSLERVQGQARGLIDRMRGVKGYAPWVEQEFDELVKGINTSSNPAQLYKVMRDIPMGLGVPDPIASAQLRGRGATPIKSIWDPIADDVHAVLNDLKRAQTPQPTQQHVENVLGGPQRAADALRASEIPASRYFDAGSRGPGGEKTYNYVANDTSKLDILAKYGVLGPTAFGALAAQDAYGERP